MLNLKQTTSIFLALVSNATLAGSMGPVCMADDVSVPCERAGWEFGVQALYLRPSYSSAMSWVGVNTNFGTPFVTTRIENTPEWAWGFKLEGAYHFSTGTDLNLNWYHLNDKTTGITSRETALSSTLGDHLTTIKPSWDAVNLELGQGVDFGAIKNIRVHGGLQVANIRTNIGISGPGRTFDQPPIPFIYNGEANAKFTGLGPRLGIDMSYGMFRGFNLYGKGAVAVLAGRSELTQTYHNSTGVTVREITNSKVIVPELEAKLGLNYTYLLTHGNVTLDAGYLWVNYFNALFSARFARPVDNDFSVNGPYVGLKWLGAAV